MVEVQDISKHYVSGRGRVQALTGVTLRVERGSNLALVGKSGSGKTTLLNCIGGIERPDAGTVTLDGRNLNLLSERQLSLLQRRHIGFVFQHGNLISFLTAEENIAFPLSLNGVGTQAKNQRVAELLDMIGLPEIGPAMPHELSGGELQRVAVARAIAHKPDLLLADEPTANLDSATGKAIMELMITLSRREGCTLIMATHDLELIALADLHIPLRDGKIQEERSTSH